MSSIRNMGRPVKRICMLMSSLLWIGFIEMDDNIEAILMVLTALLWGEPIVF